MRSAAVIIEELKKMFEVHFKEVPQSVMPLPQEGSPRVYYRIKSEVNSAIGSYNADIEENEAFYFIQQQLKTAGIRVPKVYLIDPLRDLYLQEDLGETTVYQQLNTLSTDPKGVRILYKKVISALVKIHYSASHEMDYSKCYPRSEFDKQSILWDLNYFKYMYLKVAHVPFVEQKLEDDFQVLTAFLDEAPDKYFLYRDFKTKNIMLKEDELYFIDFQGGRKGAAQYDVASLLYEGKQHLSNDLRKELIDHYCDEASVYENFDKDAFLKYYPAYALIRLLQVFGAYGYRGLIEKKMHFVQSIPGGALNLKSLLNHYKVGCEIPHLMETIWQIISKVAAKEVTHTHNKLTVDVYSFSYKKGIPDDYSGNGGGFVFDCRSIPNPGRQEKFKTMTGRNKEVADYIASIPEAALFKDAAQKLAETAVENYMSRNFHHLQISFGCTGGQHRSVFMAENIAAYLSKKYPLVVNLRHRELNIEQVHGKNNV